MQGSKSKRRCFMYEIKLIALYFYVCERYEEDLKFVCQRFSNNAQPAFSDAEALTVYLYAVSQEGRLPIKGIYDFASRYLRSWFPRLPSYQAFDARMNRLCTALQRLSEELLQRHRPPECSQREQIVDSLPVMTCSAKRKGKVAAELTAKGYCSTKGLYYYGLKLHALGFRREGKMPWPESIVLSGAEEHDLTVLKQNWSGREGKTIYGDKIYYDRPWFGAWQKQNQSRMLTPVKAVKGKAAVLKQLDKAAEDLFSKAVSSIRQPIESLFHWLIEKTAIQAAHKVRSAKGLLTHVFGKLAAAFIYCVFNP